MVTGKATILNKLGLHARPASHLVRTASKYKSTSVEVVREADIVNGKSILGVMMLAAGMGTELEIRVDGPDEDKCLQEIMDLIGNKFFED